jgi:hypothetical protein
MEKSKSFLQLISGCFLILTSGFILARGSGSLISVGHLIQKEEPNFGLIFFGLIFLAVGLIVIFELFKNLILENLKLADSLNTDKINKMFDVDINDESGIKREVYGMKKIGGLILRLTGVVEGVFFSTIFISEGRFWSAFISAFIGLVIYVIGFILLEKQEKVRNEQSKKDEKGGMKSDKS